MAIQSGFFKSTNGDRKYDATWFAQYFAAFIGNGIFPNPSTNLQTVEGTNMTTNVKPGKGWINGYFVVNDSDYVLQHDNADGVLKRIDRIVMRLNYLTRQIEIVIKKGTFASSPVAPVLQRDADYHELALADVLINNGATAITQANITDQRLNTSLCGVVHGVVEQVDTTTIFNQYMAWFNSVKDGTEQEIALWQTQQEQAFNDWFATVQNILNGDVAGNLLNLINQNKESITELAGVGRTTETVKGNYDLIENHKKDYVSHPAYADTTGTNAYSVTLNPAPSSLVAGIGVVIKVCNAATGACTININGLGAINILKANGLPVTDLKANAVYSLRHNGTAFILQGEGGIDKLPIENTKYSLYPMIIKYNNPFTTTTNLFGSDSDYIYGMSSSSLYKFSKSDHSNVLIAALSEVQVVSLAILDNDYALCAGVTDSNNKIVKVSLIDGIRQYSGWLSSNMIITGMVKVGKWLFINTYYNFSGNQSIYKIDLSVNITGIIPTHVMNVGTGISQSKIMEYKNGCIFVQLVNNKSLTKIPVTDVNAGILGTPITISNALQLNGEVFTISDDGSYAYSLQRDGTNLIKTNISTTNASTIWTVTLPQAYNMAIHSHDLCLYDGTLKLISDKMMLSIDQNSGLIKVLMVNSTNIFFGAGWSIGFYDKIDNAFCTCVNMYINGGPSIRMAIIPESFKVIGI